VKSEDNLVDAIDKGLQDLTQIVTNFIDQVQAQSFNSADI